MPGTIACTSTSLDRCTQLITVVEGVPAEWGGLEACIAGAIASGRTRVVVDFSRAGGMRPSLLPPLFRGQRWLGWRGGRLAVVCPPGISSPSMLNGLSSSIDVYSDAEAARTAVSAA